MEGWFSAYEIIDVVTSKTPKKNGELQDRSRTIRKHLKELVKIGDVTVQVKEATGQRGRAPEIFMLSGKLRKSIDEYLNIKEVDSVKIYKLPVGNELPLYGRVIFTNTYKEIGDQKICVERKEEVSASSKKPFLLSAIMTARRLGHPTPPDEQIEKLKKECGI